MPSELTTAFEMNLRSDWNRRVSGWASRATYRHSHCRRSRSIAASSRRERRGLSSAADRWARSTLRRVSWSANSSRAAFSRSRAFSASPRWFASPAFAASASRRAASDFPCSVTAVSRAPAASRHSHATTPPNASSTAAAAAAAYSPARAGFRFAHLYSRSARPAGRAATGSPATNRARSAATSSADG